MPCDISELKSIAIEYLFDGMSVFEDIYNYNGKILLLAKGIILTETKIRQLSKFNDNYRNISVFHSTYQDLIEHGIPTSNSLDQEYLENKVGYTGIKDKTNELLKDIKNKDSVSQEDTCYITDEISEKLQIIDPSLIFQCINASNPIDEYLRTHSVNVALMNGLMGKWLNLSGEDVDLLVLAGLIHDIGKTKIPPEILNVPEKLTTSEFEVMKMHPIYSYDLLSKDSRFTESVKLAARHHHEKMNGSGYPDQLNALQISLFARITAVSDIYDAMVSKRPYKDANNPFTVISQLSNKQFSELDMKLVTVFTDHMPSELVGKSVLLSDASIAIIKYIVPNDLENPIVEVNGVVKQLNKNLYCTRMVFDK